MSLSKPPIVLPSKRPEAILLPPRRGLIHAATASGNAFSKMLLKKWIQVNARGFHAEKIDVHAESMQWPLFDQLLKEQGPTDPPLALRTQADAPPPDLRPWADRGLLDLFLCPQAGPGGALRAWCAAAQQAGLAIRMRLMASNFPACSIQFPVEDLAGMGLRYLALYLKDPEKEGAPPAYDSEALAALLSYAEAALEQGVDLRLYDLPYCQTPSSLWPALVQARQRPLDSQGYLDTSLALAVASRRIPPHRLEQSLESYLGEKAAFHTELNQRILPWLINGPRRFLPLWIAHKFRRLRKESQVDPAPLPAACRACRMRIPCNHGDAVLGGILPMGPRESIQGATVYHPFPFRDKASAYCDACDLKAIELDQCYAALAQEARQRIATRPPDVVLSPKDYRDQAGLATQSDTVVQWRACSRRENLSTVLAQLSPPFSVACTVGGGIAERVGFRFARHSALLAPMLAYHHELILHVDAAGNYVLLRDGQVVSPAELAPGGAVPRRIGDQVKLQLALENIDGEILSYEVRIWQDAPSPVPRQATDFSVIIVCTRFARRLEAALKALAHQPDFDPSRMEVLVCYVPGLDATEDLLQSFALAYPALRLVRAPFPEARCDAKGFMINKACGQSQGDWIVLLDADILVPPDFFVRLAQSQEGAFCMAPEGRKMLDATTTAKVLSGALDPWDECEGLLEGPGEYRDEEAGGIPIGYCQCVRREVLEAIPYGELDHFEGADWAFGENVVQRYGKERRVPGLRLLHLDHGGSQWFGARRHW